MHTKLGLSRVCPSVHHVIEMSVRAGMVMAGAKKEGRDTYPRLNEQNGIDASTGDDEYAIKRVVVRETLLGVDNEKRRQGKSASAGQAPASRDKATTAKCGNAERGGGQHTSDDSKSDAFL